MYLDQCRHYLWPGIYGSPPHPAYLHPLVFAELYSAPSCNSGRSPRLIIRAPHPSWPRGTRKTTATDGNRATDSPQGRAGMWWYPTADSVVTICWLIIIGISLFQNRHFYDEWTKLQDWSLPVTTRSVWERINNEKSLYLGISNTHRKK